MAANMPHRGYKLLRAAQKHENPHIFAPVGKSNPLT